MENYPSTYKYFDWKRENKVFQRSLSSQGPAPPWQVDLFTKPLPGEPSDV